LIAFCFSKTFPSAQRFQFESGEKFYEVDIESVVDGNDSVACSLPPPPYKIRVNNTSADMVEVTIKSYSEPISSPYPEERAPKNKVRFTKAQIQAIQSGIHPVS
jgi:hypothetical protein